ncbi:hypothetical protein HPB47_003140 [Ixodes persulcatus]|uniref:Uncharacterized protein n=1 Tax=Ixodes persulcatus TaxID=34615 RepID=A0AC60PJQ3_IXOPE|nr:hypothetical protein HPB47_003140 [Ixodes persulcatus]
MIAPVRGDAAGGVEVLGQWSVVGIVTSAKMLQLRRSRNNVFLKGRRGDRGEVMNAAAVGDGCRATAGGLGGGLGRTSGLDARRVHLRARILLVTEARNLHSEELLVGVDTKLRREALLKLTAIVDVKVSVNPHCTLNTIGRVLSQDDLLQTSGEELLEGLKGTCTALGVEGHPGLPEDAGGGHQCSHSRNTDSSPLKHPEGAYTLPSLRMARQHPCPLLSWAFPERGARYSVHLA